MQATLKFRVKDKHAKLLSKQARAVNFVWNYCNDAQKHALKWGKKWPTGFDLMKLVAGSSELLDVHSGSIQKVCAEYDKSRRQHKKRTLKYRGKKSLGWVPFNTGHVTFKDGAFYFRRQRYDVWLTRDIPNGSKFGIGSFNQDSRGRWYLNVPVEIEQEQSTGTGIVGVDLGLKELATLSTGEKIEAQRFYRDLEEKLGQAQRANNKRRVKAIHAKIGNRRKDFLHKESTRLVKENAAIFVGDVNSSALAKTKMAKSVLDAGWFAFKCYLEYKAIRHKVHFEVVNERYTTVTCSVCKKRTGPKGQEGLRIREWSCECGITHDRDVNAARNILAAGHCRLAGGIHHA